VVGGESSNMESNGVPWDRRLLVAPDRIESYTVSLWKSRSSSSPDAKLRISLSEPINVEARSPTSEDFGFELRDP
jgi:hypothetical protein